MTGWESVAMAYGVGLVVLGGYAVRIWMGYRRAGR
jgi:hypothetical protein